MKLLILSSTLLLGFNPSTIAAFKIEINAPGQENPTEISKLTRYNRIKQLPKPVLGAFADHLNTIASLFSSLIGTGAYIDNSQDQDALDCQHMLSPHGFGPYCMISYDSSKSCYQEFGCEFYDAEINFSAEDSDAKLCCMKNWDDYDNFEPTFDDSFDPNSNLRLFQPNQNNVGSIYSINKENATYELQVKAGHFGIAEIIYSPKSNAESLSYHQIINSWSGCPFSEESGQSFGYHTIDSVPSFVDQYKSQSFDQEFVEQDKGLTLCTVEGGDAASQGQETSAAKNILTLMPFCTFKLIGQDCPAEAPLNIQSNADNGFNLPNDNLYMIESLIDASSFCCAKGQFDISSNSQDLVINLDYLKNLEENEQENPYDFFKDRYQVLKWPGVECAKFEYPEFDLKQQTVKLDHLPVYPWGQADMELTFCVYTKPRDVMDIFDDVNKNIEEQIELLIDDLPKNEEEVLPTSSIDLDLTQVGLDTSLDDIINGNEQPVTEEVPLATTQPIETETIAHILLDHRNVESSDYYDLDDHDDEEQDQGNGLPEIITVDDHQLEYMGDIDQGDSSV